MKQSITTKILASLLFVASLASCSQEIEPQQTGKASSNTPLVALHEEAGGDVVTLNAQATLEEQDDNLRAFPYNIQTQNYEHSYTVNRRKLTESVKVHYPVFNFNAVDATVPMVAVIRNTQWDISRASLVIPVTFNKGTNKLTISQAITLPTGAGTSRWGMDGWRMLLFAGGTLDPETGVYSSSRVSKPLPSIKHNGGAVTLNTIFVNKAQATANDPWIPITATTTNGVTRFSTPAIVMEPQGTLLMLQAKNETTTRTAADNQGRVFFRGFVISTNIASPKASYSLFSLQHTAMPQYEGIEGGFGESFIYDENRADILRPMDPDQTHASRYSPVQMLYVFPMEAPQGENRKFEITAQFAGYNTQTQQATGVVGRTESSSSPLRNKTSYHIQLNISSGRALAAERAKNSLKHPIEMLLVDNSNTAKTYGPGRFSSTAEKEVFTNGRSYYMPTDNELRILVPGMSGGVQPGGILTNPIIRFGENFESTYSPQEPIQVYQETRPFHSQYINPGGNVSYGLRFLNNMNEELRSAYRYERIYEGSTPKLKITVYHLGKDLFPGLTVRDLTNESWWRENKSKALNVYERFIPQGRYWSSSGMPAMPRKKVVMRIFIGDPHDPGDRTHGAFITDYNSYRKWAELEANTDTRTLLFTRDQMQKI